MAASSSSKFWSVIENLCLSDVNKRPAHLLHLIKIIKEEKTFKNKDSAREFTQRIKKWFSSLDDRWIALCLMPIFLKDFDAEIVCQNAIFWMRSLMQIISSKPSRPVLELTLKCIPKLLKLSVEFDDVAREFSLNLVHPFLTNLISFNNTESYIVASRANIYRQCIVHYPGPMGRFRSQIENQCLSLLSHTQDAVRLQACRCLAVLPRCGSAGEKGSKFAEFWNKQFCLVLNTLLELLEGLFYSSADNNTDQPSKSITLKLPKISLTEPQHSIVLSTQIQSLIFILEEMLSYKFPNTLNVNVHSIISLCVNIFGKEIDQGNISIEYVCISAVLPQLWSAALSLINTLAMQVGSLIMPYESTISHIIYQVLSFAHKDGRAVHNEHPTIRIQAYKLFINWNNAIGQVAKEMVSKVVELVLNDIKPQFSSEKAMISKSNGKHKKQKNGRKLQDVITESEMAGKKVDRTENNNVAYVALQVLEALISSTGPMIPIETILKIQHGLVSVGNMIADPAKQSSQDFPAPFGSIKCRKQLLHSIYCLMNLYHHQLPTCGATFISIFQSCLNDQSKAVAADCKCYLSLSDKILHPSVPSLRVYHEQNMFGKKFSQQESLGELNGSKSMGLLDGLKHHTMDLSYQRFASTGTGEALFEKRVDVLESQTVETDLITDLNTMTTTGISSLPHDSLLVSDDITSSTDHKTQDVISNCHYVKPSNFAETEARSSGEIVAFIEKPFEKVEIERASKLHMVREDESCDKLKEDGSVLLPKRQRLDIGLEQENIAEITEPNESSSIHQDERQVLKMSQNDEVLNFAEPKAGKLAIDVDDETSAFLNSFVNSYPDSE